MRTKVISIRLTPDNLAAVERERQRLKKQMPAGVPLTTSETLRALALRGLDAGK